MIASIKLESLTLLLRVQPVAAAEARATSVFATTPQHAVHPEAPGLAQTPVMAQSTEPVHRPPSTVHGQTAASASRQATAVPAGPKVGRNDPCPCASGRKYKKCHGK